MSKANQIPSESYTKMPNKHLRDPALSLKAKGLMSLLISLPPEWELSVAGLSAINKDGRESISSTLAELEFHGYITLTRQQRTNGKFGKIEIGIDLPGRKNRIGKPAMVNQIYKEKTPPKKHKEKAGPSEEQTAAFERWWKLYPKKQDKTRSLKLYTKALAEVGEEKLLKGLLQYKAELNRRHTELKYTKMPSTWLNGKCWEDEYESESTPSVSASGLPISKIDSVDF